VRRLYLGAGVLLTTLSAATVHATDFVSVRAGFSGAAVSGGARYAASAGATFEANVVPDVIGVRLGGDAVYGGWFASGSGNTLGLRPEIAFYPGPDDVRLRLFGTVRWQIAAVGFDGASGHWVEALEMGPELEWRRPADSWFRLRLGAFFAPGRDAQGAFRWPGAALAFTVEYGKPTLAAVVVPKDCIPLPTRPCPPK
jgi:hypothetical protein